MGAVPDCEAVSAAEVGLSVGLSGGVVIRGLGRPSPRQLPTSGRPMAATPNQISPSATSAPTAWGR